MCDGRISTSGDHKGFHEFPLKRNIIYAQLSDHLASGRTYVDHTRKSKEDLNAE